ncbi:MAG: hypothetical protein QOE51_4148 [Actinoplanes sp.]|nr:hypothetical protein [Actinoplanes sp.]
MIRVSTLGGERPRILTADAASDPAQRVLSSVAVRVGGRLVTMVTGAASLAIVTRLLSPGQFGFFVTATTVVTLASVLIDGGLVSVGVRDSARSGSTDDMWLLAASVTAARLAVSTAVVAVTLVAVQLAYPGAGGAQVRLATGILAVTLPLGALSGGFQMVAESTISVAPLVAADIAGRCVSLGFAGYALAAHQGLAIICWGWVAGALTNVAVLSAVYRRILPLRRLPHRTVLRLMRASFPLGVALVLNAVYFRVDTVMISLMRPASEVGSYGVAYRLLEVVLSLGAFVLAALLPVFSASARDPERWQSFADTSFRLLFALGLVVAVCGSIMAPAIVATFSGTGYGAAGSALSVLLLAGALSWVNGCGGTMLVSIDRQRNALWLNVTALSVNVALNLALIPRFGFMAAAWTTAGCELVNFAGMLVLLRRYAGYRWHVEGWRSIVVLTGVCALGTAGLREVGFPAIAVTGIVAAVWSAVALRVGIVPMSLLPNRSGAEAVG